MALLASRSGIRRWSIFAWINAGIIVFSIFYLGIHWFTDMIAGVTLALFAVTVGLKVCEWADRSACIGLTVNSKAKLKASRPIGS
jgi:membrane-associated phospholipid phosphatase